MGVRGKPTLRMAPILPLPAPRFLLPLEARRKRRPLTLTCLVLERCPLTLLLFTFNCLPLLTLLSTRAAVRASRAPGLLGGILEATQVAVDEALEPRQFLGEEREARSSWSRWVCVGAQVADHEPPTTCSTRSAMEGGVFSLRASQDAVPAQEDQGIVEAQAEGASFVDQFRVRPGRFHQRFLEEGEAFPRFLGRFDGPEDGALQPGRLLLERQQGGFVWRRQGLHPQGDDLKVSPGRRAGSSRRPRAGPGKPGTSPGAAMGPRSGSRSYSSSFSGSPVTGMAGG